MLLGKNLMQFIKDHIDIHLCYSCTSVTTKYSIRRQRAWDSNGAVLEEKNG